MSFSVSKPIICLITSGEATDSNVAGARAGILKIIGVAVEEKIAFVQIREKCLSARLLFELTKDAANITSGSATALLVNDRADIAFAAKADGVHLAANSLPVAVIRRSFPREFIIGVSTHSLDATIDAARQEADFAVFGPVFHTPNKGEPRGLAELSRVCEELHPFPVIGLGGIDKLNCESILESGAAGFAAIRLLNDLSSLRSIARRFRK